MAYRARFALQDIRKRGHPVDKCRCQEYVCHMCGIKGHLAPMCTQKKSIHRKSASNNSSFKTDNHFNACMKSNSAYTQNVF